MNESCFDLEAAVKSWRENLSQSPPFEVENLNELESHLRDSMPRCVSRALRSQ